MFLNPHQSQAHTCKVQLHCHTTQSDGNLTPAAVAAEYERLGFDALAITDHDSLTSRPTVDPGGHTLLFLSSIEESFGVSAFPERTCHLTAVGTILRYPDPEGGGKPSGQDVIDAQAGAFLTLAHPTYATGNPWATIPDQEIVALNGYHAIEIRNTHCCHYAGKEGAPEDKWEVALNSGKRIWGVAADDSHNYAATPPVQGGAYCLVSVEQRTRNAVLTALKNGNFYATESPLLFITGDDNRLSIGTNASSEIVWRGPAGTLRVVTQVKVDTFEPPRDAAWVRAIVTRHADGCQAWSQPFFNFSADR